MKNFTSIKDAFAKEGLDVDKLEIIGCPARHVEAAKAMIKSWVGIDHVNEGYNPNWENSNYKYQNYYWMGSSSGVGFSFDGCACWIAFSSVGSRLVSENRENSIFIVEHPEFLELAKTWMVYKRPAKLDKDTK